MHRGVKSEEPAVMYWHAMSRMERMKFSVYRCPVTSYAVSLLLFQFKWLWFWAIVCSMKDQLLTADENPPDAISLCIVTDTHLLEI